MEFYCRHVVVTLSLRESHVSFDLFFGALTKFLHCSLIRNAFCSQGRLCQVIYEIDHPDPEISVYPHVHLFYAMDSDFAKLKISTDKVRQIWRKCAELDYDPFVYVQVLDPEETEQ